MEEISEDSGEKTVLVDENKKESVPHEATAVLSTSLLECPICLQLLGEPITTPCGHTFCRFCLVFALRKTKKKCPACRQDLAEACLCCSECICQICVPHTGRNACRKHNHCKYFEELLSRAVPGQN
eukprot:758784-Hanusia_phi.AAC.8